MPSLHTTDRSRTLHPPELSPPRDTRARRAWCAAAAAALSLAAFDATAALAEYKSTSNTIVVNGGGDMTLSKMMAEGRNFTPEALQRVDTANKVWLLTANIEIRDPGTRLLLTRDDINELRLKSNPTADPVNAPQFVWISANPGQILIDGVKITSWDTTANAVDNNIADGRAFINARSKADATTGAPLQSRMDVLNSEIAYLGYHDSESWGLSWKANGDLSKIDVFGNVIDSHIHHLYFAVYSYGLQGDGSTSGVWRGNHVHDNVGYGFDAHDDSDQLVIENNNVHDNGNHGIILSERCDGARIANNTSNNNGLGEGKKANGIMLHDLSDNALIENNTTNGNSDAGIAIFCSDGSTVRGNTAAGNLLSGIRLSVGSKSNTIENNTVRDSGQYGFYLYKGADTKGVCGSNLIPRQNTFVGNTVTNSGLTGLKISDGTENRFERNTLHDGASIRNPGVSETQTVTFVENTFDGDVIQLDGDAAAPMLAEFSKQPAVNVGVKTGTTARFTDDTGAIFDLPSDVMVKVTGSNSLLDVTVNNVTSPVMVHTRPLLVTNDGGSSVFVAPTLWDTDKSWILSAEDAADTVNFSVGDLQPGVAYDASRGSTTIGSFVADGAGKIAFTDSPGTTNTVTYTITRSAVQPQSSGGGGGGGGALGGLLVAALGLAALARRRFGRV